MPSLVREARHELHALAVGRVLRGGEAKVVRDGERCKRRARRECIEKVLVVRPEFERRGGGGARRRAMDVPHAEERLTRGRVHSPATRRIASCW